VVPLKQATSSEIADALVEKFINPYTASKAWITDQGSNFISSVMRRIARKYKISMYKTTAYRSNGSIERSHHVLMEYLKQWAGKGDWDKYLTHAIKAYNTSVHEGIEFTPHELVFGRTARVPVSSQLADDNDEDSYPEYATALFKRIFDAQASAPENLKQAKIRSKRYYDRRTNPQAFKHNYVYLLKEPSKSKCDEQYIGSFQILETLDNNNVRLEISDKRTKLVHGDKIRICKARPTVRP